MTPAARVAAAIGVLDHILGGQPAEQALLRWSRGSRFAGSGDRSAVRDLVFDALRCRDSFAALGGPGGRGLMIGALRAEGRDPATIFSGEGHAPAPLSPDEGHGPALEGDLADIPDWIAPMWRASLTGDAVPVAQAMRHRAPVWIRVNTLRATPAVAIASLASDGIEVAQNDHLPTALRVLSGERKLSRARAYTDGLVELQDLSPQLACAALPIAPRGRVLDYCAGGGGKTLALAGRAQGLRLVAHDADPARMADLPARATRAGAQVQVTTRPSGAFDLVIADVPCSGSGTWRRTPDAKWRLTSDMLAQLVVTQAQILRQVAGHLRPGGHLAYMTCSVLVSENADQVALFVNKNNEFSVVSQRFWTPLTGSDGFFLALMQRTR